MWRVLFEGVPRVARWVGWLSRRPGWAIKAALAAAVVVFVVPLALLALAALAAGAAVLLVLLAAAGLQATARSLLAGLAGDWARPSSRPPARFPDPAPDAEGRENVRVLDPRQ